MASLAAQRCGTRAAAPAAAAQGTARPGAPRLPARGPAAAAARRRLAPVRAEPFNEGAAQVRRLVDRDRKELNLDELEAAFGDEPASSSAAPSSAAAADAAGSSSAAPDAPPRSPFNVNSAQADKSFVSPFGPSSSGSSSPFGSPGGAAKRPFAEPAGLSPNMPTPKQDSTPWWTKITLTQIVIVLSFTTIIGLMISTFFFVLSTGAIHFNE
ncbi:hypothetical protein C2E21_2534 [Chlorella sorokiniana]|uniref:Uncharacterized protein n=1 Tax=Chlorella sorokiniana TaxID=3076 RepID=A0A2P6TXK8_CHLSO|nr:hypothetical protein C2E21_2534 [Chlorella sorokiniana]|eukprot:PRW58807.1 hypothetical protein C2E21_2534 [Chlorella sorokiniana]